MAEPHLLIGAYALDALDDLERAGFELHLRDCPACAHEVAELRASAAALAERVTARPPDRVRSHVLAAVAWTRQLPPPVQVRPSRVLPRRHLILAAAAVLIATGAGLGGIAWQGQRTGGHRAITAFAAGPAARISRVLSDPNRVTTAARVAAGGRATVISAGGDAVLATSGLPAPPAGRTYQVWLFDGTGKHPEGLIQAGTGECLIAGVAVGSRVAVSLEPAGGSTRPTSNPVVNLRIA